MQQPSRAPAATKNLLGVPARPPVLAEGRLWLRRGHDFELAEWAELPGRREPEPVWSRIPEGGNDAYVAVMLHPEFDL